MFCTIVNCEEINKMVWPLCFISDARARTEANGNQHTLWPTAIVCFCDWLGPWFYKTFLIKKNLFIVPFCLFDLLNIHIKLWKRNDFRRVCSILSLNENRKSQPRNRKICLQVFITRYYGQSCLCMVDEQKRKKWLVNGEGKCNWSKSKKRSGRL